MSDDKPFCLPQSGRQVRLGSGATADTSAQAILDNGR